MITDQQVRQLTDQITEISQPQKIILFGSYAYGEPNEDSDLDIMVVLPFEGHWAYKAVEIRLKLPIYDFPLDLLVRSPQQVRDRLAIGDPFIREIVEEGKVLYDATYARMD